MRRHFAGVLTVGLLATALCAPAGAVVDLAVGVYGGVGFPVDVEADAGSVIGAKLRVLPPIPIIGVEAYYQRMGQGDAEEAWNDGDVNVDFEGDGFEVFGADVLVGGVRGVPGFKWYGIAGVNFVEFSDKGSSENRMGGELGLGLEVAPPAIGLSVEARAMIAFIGMGAEPDPQVATLTIGLNYYF